MPRSGLKCTLLLFILSAPLRTFGQFPAFLFEQLTINNGLSNNSVNAILQTRDGYLWIATKDGLNRYDGRSFRVYKRSATAAASLPENYVMSLLESRDGTLWIGTWGGGLCRFDAFEETFTRVDMAGGEDDFIQTLTEDREGHIWYGTTKGGLVRLDPASGNITCYARYRNWPPGFPADNIASIAFDAEQNLWIGSQDAGLILVQPITGAWRRFSRLLRTGSSLFGEIIWHIHNDGGENLLISTETGLECFNLRRKQYVDCPFIPQTWETLLTTSVRQTLRDRWGRLWLGTYNYIGLFLIDTRSVAVNRINRFQRDDDNPHSILSDRIRCLYEDHRGNLWFGTEEGISKLPVKQPFMQYRHLPRRDTSLGGRVVSSILESDDKILWVGMGGGGVDRIDLRSQDITHFKHDSSDANSLTENDIVTLYQDRDRILWIGTNHAGMNRYDPVSGRFSAYLHDDGDPGTIRSNWVQQILETREGLFLVGTNEALQVMDRTSGVFRPFMAASDSTSLPFPEKIQINALYQDRQGEIWIGTWLDGLWRCHPGTGRLIHYLPDPQQPGTLNCNKVTTIFEDSKGRIWIGTHSGGFDRFDRESGTFTNYSTRDGLPNDVVFGILEDDRGRLWISTLNGLVRFDPQTGQFRIYDESDGLVNNQFNWRASCRGSEGIMYFGGTNGLVAFHPDSIRTDAAAPPVAFTSFKLFDKEAVLSTPLRAGAEIVLPHDKNFFTIEYAALDLAPATKHRYAYLLSGIDPDWVYPGAETKAIYTDISPGAYTFFVTAANADGIWSELLALSITVHPPWWQRWYSIITLATLLLLAGTTMVRYWLNQQLQLHHIRFNIASDLHDEIGSNLSSIRVESQMLLRNELLGHKDREHLMTISQTAKETIDAMRDIIWFINPNNDASDDIALKMRETAARLLAGVQWSLAVVPGVKLNAFDLEIRRQLFLIYKEALTNVARHASATQCSITIGEIDEEVQLTIQDDGAGFDVTQVRQNTGLLNMHRRARKIGATLELFTRPGEGMLVKLTLPYKTRSAALKVGTRAVFLKADAATPVYLKKLINLFRS